MPSKLKPRTKKEFSDMLMRDYGYSEKLAKDAAAIVAGHGAFPEEKKTPMERLMVAAQEICNYSHEDSDDDYQEAIEVLRAALEEAQASYSGHASKGSDL